MLSSVEGVERRVKREERGEKRAERREKRKEKREKLTAKHKHSVKEALFNHPGGLAVAKTHLTLGTAAGGVGGCVDNGDVYVADTYNHAIRLVTFVESSNQWVPLSVYPSIYIVHLYIHTHA